MDFETSSDIYVAPLLIKKSAGDLHASSETVQTLYDVRPVAVMLQPDEFDGTEGGEQSQPIFQNYLRAIYPFSPSASLSPSTVTLSLNAGDVVLVHSIHTNGWADGTLLDNGARGWLPTNYCEAYEEVAMRPLLKGLTEFWDLIRTGSTTSLEVFRNQDYMRGLIAGVRLLLERSDCLTRDDILIKTNERLRKTRKALLSDLSLLVKAAKRLQDLVVNPGTNGNDAVDETLDEMLLKAFKIVIRGVRFLEIWDEKVNISPIDEGLVLADGHQNLVSTEAFPKSAATYSTQQHQSHASGTSISSNASRFPSSTAHEQRISVTPSSPAARGSNRHSRTTSVHYRRQSITHRMSYCGDSAGGGRLKLASDQLSRCYDAFLGVLATFYGSHLQSRSSSELLLSTQHAVKSCRELLAVIELVIDNSGSPSDRLLEAKDVMYDRITELVHAARGVFRPASSADEESIFLPEDGKHLLNAATACVRVAGECVAETRRVLEQMGDFEVNQSAQRSSTTPIDVPDSPVLPTEQMSPLRPSTAVNIGRFSHENIEASPPNPQGAITPGVPSPPTRVPPPVPPSPVQDKCLPPTPVDDSAETGRDQTAVSPVSSITPTDEALMAVQLRRSRSSARNVVVSTGSDSTFVSSVRDSERGVVSSTSTRATSPDAQSHHASDEEVAPSFSESQATLTEEIDETEAKLMEKTFAHELMFNKEGQVIGGTLNALIEKLTAHDSTPDALFVSTFYLTFRLFVTPEDFAAALAARFDYVGNTPRVAGPVRLRVYNVFKGWLESHWRHDCDDVALSFVAGFGKDHLSPVLPAAGKRLQELTEQIMLVSGPLVPRLISSIGKTNTSFASYVNLQSPVPEAIISRSQLISLRTWKMGGSGVSVVDFDPLELARQITLKVSSLFCSILPEELLATEWTKRSGSLAVNVRAMSTLSTDLANLVADSILQLEEPKKRAATIKQWIKIANRCLELNNFDTLMAIICSLNSTTILRLKKTWDIVSQKTKNLLESLSKVVEFSRNHVVLRQRLQNIRPPCLPFVGMYLTDLTFVDHGNQMTRQLTTDAGVISLINFDKHIKTAKIISDLQRFQIPYRFTEVPELQTWMQDQLIRVRSAEEATFQNHYRRSLILEPREPTSQHNSPIDGTSGQKDKEKFDFLAWTHITKEKAVASHS